MSRKFLRKRVSVPIAAACLAVTASLSMADENKLFVSGENNYWQSAEVAEGSAGTTVTVNANTKYQVFKGFAGTVNEAGWDALSVLSAADKDKAMKLLFDKTDGIGFQWVRIPIGASDYALKRYSLNDSKTDDLKMDNFSITRDKEYLIPYIKAAQAIKPDIHFWASPWTPPPWMKKNAFDPDGFDGGDMRNEPSVFDAHALYFSKFIEAYKGENIPIDAVCPQNEPGYTRNYPTCGWGKYNYEDKSKNKSGDTPDNQEEYLSTFVANHLYPKLKQDHPQTEIWFGTLSNDKTAAGYWNGMKAKDTKREIIKGLGLQWNNITMVPANTSNYLVFCSEHKCGNYYWKTEVSNIEQADAEHFYAKAAPNNHAYGLESWGLIKEWLEKGTHMYSAWNMILDTEGFNLNSQLKWPQNSLLAVNRAQKTLKVTAYYYVMRHIGQYVDSGAVRIQASGSNALAFQNPDGSIVTIVHNPGSSDAETAVSVSGKSYKVKIPKKGWATLAIGLKPVSTKENTRNQFNSIMGLKVTSTGDAYKVSLPSRESGRVELLTVSGRVLETKAIPQGCSELSFSKNASYSGLMLVRAIYGAQTLTTRLFNAQ